MITIFMSVRTHENKIAEFRSLASRFSPTTRAEDGCIDYVFHQQINDPRIFILREQWRDREALDEHVKQLWEVLGPPKPGHRLPAALFDLCETIEVNLYDIVA